MGLIKIGSHNVNSEQVAMLQRGTDGACIIALFKNGVEQIIHASGRSVPDLTDKGFVRCDNCYINLGNVLSVERGTDGEWAIIKLLNGSSKATSTSPFGWSGFARNLY